MPVRVEGGLAGRERLRLRRARENGYLDATNRDNQKLIKAYGFWCWQLKIPMVWFERRTPWSKYGRIHLDLFTTQSMLTLRGRSALKALSDIYDAALSAHDGRWDRVPRKALDKLAADVFKTATRTGHTEPNRPKLVNIGARKAAKLIALRRSEPAGARPA